MNYDDQVLGTGNPDHPANQTELPDREMLTEVYNVNSDILEIFDRIADDKEYYQNQFVKNMRAIADLNIFIYQIKETLSASENGHCIIVKNQIENFLNK